jgi:hypothetical protein
MANHHVYLFKSECLARLRDGSEVPIYKVGYSSNVSRRHNEFSIPGKMELLETLDFDSEKTARMVERFLLEYTYPSKRILGQRNRRTEYMYLTGEQFEHLYANFIQFKDKDVVANFEEDMDKIGQELDGLGRQCEKIMGMKVKDVYMSRLQPVFYIYAVDDV